MKRILHVVTKYGEVSETFVPTAVAAVDASGKWESSVAAFRISRRDQYPYPPDDRVIVAKVASLARRALDKAQRRPAEERFADDIFGQLGARRFDLIHAHFGWSALYAEPLALRLRVPLVVTWHGSDVKTFPGDRPGVYDRLFDRMAHALVVSTELGEELAELGYDGPWSVIQAGVRTDQFCFRANTPAKGGRFTVIHVGRLTPRKGVDLLIRAVAGLAHDVDLEVLGDGPERAELERLASFLGIADRVHFRGAVDSTEVRRSMERAHVFVMASRTMPDGEAEGSPVVLKEAMAVGLPFVVTRNGGIPENVPPAFRDEIVAEDDVRGLTAQLDVLLAAPRDWPRRAALAREWVVENYDVAALARRTIQVYESAISRNAAPS
jgi:colanic acid/amylovoran biosynthesis glycosyltransferase